MKGGMLPRSEIRFMNWMDRVEKIVLKRIGKNLLDLPDEDYRMKYDNKTSPTKMAKYIIDDYKKYCQFIGL
jgi:hypothetical protein